MLDNLLPESISFNIKEKPQTKKEDLKERSLTFES
jgi:hypothetical protein